MKKSNENWREWHKSKQNPLSIIFFSSYIYSLLKSIEYHHDQTENSSKKIFEQNRPIKTEQTQIKLSENNSESKYN